jgi:rhodanese-related sulfurtransferase
MVTTLTARELSNLLTGQDVDLVDVRDEHEFLTGHIPGARNVPLDQLRGDPDHTLPRDRIVFVCAKGVRSLAAAKLADRLGFTTVYSLDGGTNAWSRDGLPVAVEHRAAA